MAWILVHITKGHMITDWFFESKKDAEAFAISHNWDFDEVIPQQIFKFQI